MNRVLLTSLFLLTVIVSGFLFDEIFALSMLTEVKLTASDAAANDQFGESVSIFGFRN